MFFGINSRFFPSCEALLRRVFDLCAEFVVPRYGFAYGMSLEDEPASYAMGARRTTLEDFRTWLRNRSAGIPRQRTPDDAWQEELSGRQRYLDGLFRGAYPANILSESHIEGAKLHSAGIGTLEQLRGDIWLWDISPEDLPRANEYLAERHVLVQQAE